MVVKHCCKNMDYYADPKYKGEHELVYYDQGIRAYNFVLHGTKFGMYQTLWYCPWCGTKFSKDLNEEWDKLVKEKLGIKYISDVEWDEIPEEYKTDEWWRKRGL